MSKKKLWLRSAASAAVLALALTACGGSGEEDGAATTGKGGASQEKEPGKGEAEKGEAGKAEGGKGGELAAGEKATSAFDEDGTEVTYEIVAEKVDVGTAEDTKKLVSDPKKAEGLVPAVAHVEFTVKDGGPVADYPDVGGEIEVHADGQRGTILIGASEDAPGCESTSDIKNWKAGESHVICDTFMVPETAKELTVQWAADRDADPFVWSFQNS
ncbi:MULTISPECIES: hypothetical protein [Streptomyces]|uniref:Lipoprotein n=3 Tax=Streptomyces TaxID=1883 RepID=A0A8H9LNH6_9ACTN|nr:MULTISPECIES: hypothetical protein [Streptomyces]NEE51820.1 hypothetical protein [Streptomyces sp. SID8455]MBL3806754.1 hypothetical protein [Streptomyces sp. BRB081]RPK92053.1 hypothetical protein EES47_03655 [Streptomyces sp. ADI98-12]SUP62547.1 Lipoprotein [Streptomyces griseus]GFH70991.1 lipoprotein [Streptomyces diastaticus subsp. diastaticus]